MTGIVLAFDSRAGFMNTETQCSGCDAPIGVVETRHRHGGAMLCGSCATKEDTRRLVINAEYAELWHQYGSAANKTLNVLMDRMTSARLAIGRFGLESAAESAAFMSHRFVADKCREFCRMLSIVTDDTKEPE